MLRKPLILPFAVLVAVAACDEAPPAALDSAETDVVPHVHDRGTRLMLEGTPNQSYDHRVNANATSQGAINGLDGSYMWSTGGDGTTLVRIDLATGVGTTIGPSGFFGTWAGAFTPDGTLWTITQGFDLPLSSLATFDLTTGVATNVAPLGTNDVIVLESDPSGNLYAAGFDGSFYSVNTTTGQLTLIGNMGFPSIMDLAFDPSGTLWAVGNCANLYTVDPSTGAGTHQQVLTGPGLGCPMGLAAAPDGQIYMTDYRVDSPLYAVDTATGVATPVGAAMTVGPPHGGDIFGVLQVSVDIKPGSSGIPVNPRSNGVVPVAILGSADFDVAAVDVSTLAFGPGGASPAHDLTDSGTYSDHLQDVNGDGFVDLVTHYRQKQTGIAVGDTDACLSGTTVGGAPFEGCDSVSVLGG